MYVCMFIQTQNLHSYYANLRSSDCYKCLNHCKMTTRKNSIGAKNKECKLIDNKAKSGTRILIIWWSSAGAMDEKEASSGTADALVLVLSPSLFRSYSCGINTTLDIRKYARACSLSLPLSCKAFQQVKLQQQKAEQESSANSHFCALSFVFIFVFVFALFGGCICTLNGNGAYQLFFVLNSALCNLNGYGSPVCEWEVEDACMCVCGGVHTCKSCHRVDDDVN